MEIEKALGNKETDFLRLYSSSFRNRMPSKNVAFFAEEKTGMMMTVKLEPKILHQNPTPLNFFNLRKTLFLLLCCSQRTLWVVVLQTIENGGNTAERKALRPFHTKANLDYIHCSEKASKKSHFAVKSLRILRFWTNVGHANKRVEPKGIEILESKKDQQGAICSLQWFVPKLL